MTDWIVKMVVFMLAGMICWPQVIMAADGDWSLKADLQSIYGNYSRSATRDSLSGSGLILSGDYLEQAGFSIGGNYSRLNYKAGSSISQQAIYGSAHYHIYLDALPGTLTMRLDGHGINNNDVSGNTDNVRVVAPQLSFMNYTKTFYADIGYAYSTYRNNLKVHQYTPTIGFGFNQAADWVQVRGYFIHPSNSKRAQNKNSAAASEVKWTHWFAPGSWHALEFFRITGLAGERIYAVDGDAALVYNLADVQTGSGALALQWRLSDALRLMLAGGLENYRNNLSGLSYNSRFIYMNISDRW